MAEEASLYAKSVFGPSASGCGSPSAWSPPLTGLKVNFDAHVSPNGEVGVGAVVREPMGTIKLMGVKRMEGRWDASVAEAMAALYAVELVQRFGYDGIMVEGDALLVINALKRKQEGCSPLFRIFGDILK